MDDFKVIETQEDFEKAIQKRIARAERVKAEEFKDFLSPEDVEKLKATYEKKIKDIEDELKTAGEKIAGHDQIVSDLTTRATTAESTLMKNRIAHESGVPYELAGRLVGNNEEELKKDAEQLASFLTPKSAPPLRSTESPLNNDGGMAAMLSQINQQMTGGV